MEMGKLYILKEIHMKGNLQMVKLLEKDFILGKINILILVILSAEK